MTPTQSFHNFNAGPSIIAPSVKAKIHQALDSVSGGPGILELSHRSAAFENIVQHAKEEVRKAYHLPDSHETLFLQGGASLQFAMLAFNLGSAGGFINTGTWSERAIGEARTLAYSKEQEPLELWTGKEKHFNEVPQTVAIDDDPFDSVMSDTTLIV